MRTGWVEEMRDEKTLSIIIPSYNSRAYLGKCLASLVVPDILDALDVIVVNDGSTDGSESIGQTYADRYPGSFTLINKKNGGHGSAINAGAKAARGKYMKVLDADDWFLSDSLPDYIAGLEGTDADVVLTCYHTIDISTGEKKSWRCFPKSWDRTYTVREILSDWKTFDRCLMFHGITYRTDFYRENGVQLAEGVFYEDQEYAAYPFCRAETVLPLDVFVYEYRVGDAAQSVAADNQLKRIDHTETVIKKMIKNRESVTEEWAVKYCDRKIQLLVLSYMVTSMLCDKDRRRGVRRVDDLLRYVARKDRAVAEQLVGYYRILKLLNAAHVDINTYNRLLRSGLYNKLRHNRSFE